MEMKTKGEKDVRCSREAILLHSIMLQMYKFDFF